MRVHIANCNVKFVNPGIGQNGQPFAVAFVQQAGSRGIDELAVNLDATKGEIPDAGQSYDFDVDMFDGRYGTAKRIVAFSPSRALAKTG